MSFWNTIDEHMKNGFSNHANVTKLENLPDKVGMEKLDRNKLYKVQFAAISIDVVDFKSMSEATDESVFNAIMNEFAYGAIKILKNYITPSRIEIQGDAIYALYPIKTKYNIVSVFSTTCALNSFQSHLNKNIERKFSGKLKKKGYYYPSETTFKFGVGASHSYENHFSITGFGADTDLIFMGHSLNCASNIAKQANRDGRPSIIVDEMFFENLTDEEKGRIGTPLRVYVDSPYNETFYGFNWVITNYENYIENNV